MPARPAALAAVLAAVVVVILVLNGRGGSGAPGRRPFESMLQDDQQLVYGSQSVVQRTLTTLRALGVDRLRITVKWSDIAPDPGSRKPPRHFDAADPSAYSERGFARYDRIDLLAAEKGLSVDFDVTAPAPLWASARGLPSRYAANDAPSASAFRRFVTALGRRYSGRYAITIPGAGRVTLPRVSFWSVWNEPNQPGWLAPQYRVVHRRQVMVAPELYRHYVDAAYAALRATGHGHDEFLVGELAPEGCVRGTPGTCFYPRDLEPIPPIPFLRSLYCVNGEYRPLRGSVAGAAGCPAHGSPAAFVAANPGLFRATAFAHHPYSFFLAPTVSLPESGFVPLSDLGRLERGLDRVFSTYGDSRRIPLYLDEYGYETDPPNPFRGMSLSAQATYLDEATYMSWHDPRVVGLSQFLLVDSAPDTRYPRGSAGYWSTFQTGLEFLSGRPKPSLAAYRLVLWLPRPSVAHGAPVRVWAMLRAARNGTPQRAAIEWRARGGTWRTIAHATTAQADGVLQTRVVVPASGSLRVGWRAPGGVEEFSRAAAVSVDAS